MGKLSPKPTHSAPLQTWEDLDATLKRNFTEVPTSNPDVLIDSVMYEMSPEEIIAEGKKEGYTVTREGNYIRFK